VSELPKELEGLTIKDHKDLWPSKPEERTTRTLSYTLMILSMAITTSIFFLGWLSQILGLNLAETVVAAFIGNSVVALIMYFNGTPGVKYGIPFPVQLRPAFGHKGSILPLVIRTIVSIFWYGIDGYIAAWAITEMVLIIAGKPADWVVEHGLKYTPITFIVYLAFVWAFGYKRIKGIKYLDTVSGPLLMIFFAWFTIYLTRLPDLPGRVPGWTEGGVGWTSSNFFLMIAVQTAWWSTIGLNVSDLTRFNKSVSSLPVAHILGLVVPQVIGTVLGFIATSLTGGIHSPIDIIAKYTPSAAVAVFGLLFATLATGSTNVTGDVPAATNAVIRIARVRWEVAVTIATILAWVVIGPYSIYNWKKSLDVAYTLLNFNWYYSMWLGPIAGIMVMDYWVIRKRQYDMKDLYEFSPKSKYWYSGGINWIGVMSLVLGILIEYVIAAAQGNMQYYYGIPVPGIELTWYYGFFLSAIIYLVLSYAMKKYAKI